MLLSAIDYNSKKLRHQSKRVVSTAVALQPGQKRQRNNLFNRLLTPSHSFSNCSCNRAINAAEFCNSHDRLQYVNFRTAQTINGPNKGVYWKPRGRKQPS